MPRHIPHQLRWSPDGQTYVVYVDGSPVHVQSDSTAWFSWLDRVSSFAFSGRFAQRCTVRKERRQRGGDYWYAYRLLKGRTVKRYLGRTVEITSKRLEQVALLLEADPQEQKRVANAGDREQPLRFPLLETKFFPPPLRVELIERCRLLTGLESIVTSSLTLITAPAGFGKTTLIAQWLAMQKEQDRVLPFTWVSLGSEDNDPLRFWHYVCMALHRIHATLFHAPLHWLIAAYNGSFAAPALEELLTLFINDLSLLADDTLLILDDYQHITEQHIHETLSFLLHHLPPRLHLVLLSRSQPPLPLSFLRSHGLLYEVHCSDLRFLPAETEAFFQQNLGYTLDLQVEQRLEGWPVGLRLLAFVLQAKRPPDERERILSQFSGSQEMLLDYFLSEVLSKQSEEVQNFLLQTSILDRLSGQLCVAVTRQLESAQLLEQLERSGLFLERMEQASWYRYNVLFAEAMRSEAERRLGREILGRLYLRASLWFEEADLFVEAIETALQAKEVFRAARLIARLIGRDYLHGSYEMYTLRRWLEQIPGEAMQEYPELWVTYGLSLLLTAPIAPLSLNQQAAIRENLWQSEQSLRSLNDTVNLGAILTLQSLLASRRGEIHMAEGYAREALTLLPTTEQLWRAFSMGVAGQASLSAGRLSEAHQLFSQAYLQWEAQQSPHGERGTMLALGEIYVEQGMLQHAGTLYHKVLISARAHHDQLDIAQAQIGLSRLFYEWNRLEEAQQSAEEVYTLAHRFRWEEVQVRSELLLLRIRFAQGEQTEVQHALQDLQSRVALISERRPQLYQHVQLSLFQIFLATSDLFAAYQALNILNDQVLEITPTLEARIQLAAAQLLLAQGRHVEAVQILTTLSLQLQERGYHSYLLEAQLLQALAHADHREQQKAGRLLHRVLEQAVSEGYERIFLDQGEPLATLLQAIVPALHEKKLLTFTRNLLHAFARTRVQSGEDGRKALLTEPLSPREQRVLRLLAEGHSNPEIARQLVVSINTIKVQVQSIYRKLNVTNRVAASETARRLQLL